MKSFLDDRQTSSSPPVITMNGHVNSAETQKSPHAHRRRESLQLNLSADEPEEVYGLKHPVAHPRIKVADDSTTEGPGQTNLNANVHAPLADSDDEEFDDNVSISSLFADAIEELGDEKLLESDNGWHPYSVSHMKFTLTSCLRA